MQKAVRILLCIMLLLYAEEVVFASTAANSGVTGLWEYPTAEIPDDGMGRFGYTRNSPYAYYFLDMAYLPWVELTARYTLFDSIYTRGRRYQDKAIDLKGMLWHNKNPQLWYLPSIAGGISDIMGTELMKAWYWAATWRWGDFAATLGYGSDRYNGVFTGIEWDVSNWLTVKAEYGNLDYDHDRAIGQRVLKKDPSEKYNVGVVLKTTWGLQGSVSYQRGDEWAFTLSQRLNMNGTLLGASRKPLDTPNDTRIPSWNGTDKEELLSRLASGLEKFTRVRDVDLKLEETEDDGHRLTIAYENYGYSSHAEAMARVLLLLSEVLPEMTELVLIQKNAGIPIVTASFPGELLFDLRARCKREDDAIHSAVFSWATSDLAEADEEHLLAKKAQHEVKGMVVFEPRIDQTYREEYLDRWSIDLLYNGRYSHGWDGVVDVRFPVLVHVDSRSLWWEQDFNDKIRIQQGAMLYAKHFGSEGRAWLFGEGGYLDEEWFGLNLWGRYYANDGNWWLGTRVSEFHDRDPHSFGGLTNGRYRYDASHFRTWEDKDSEEWRTLLMAQAGYHFEGVDLDTEVDYGKFLDGDKGFKYSVTRHWDDMALGFWYIDTDVRTPGKDFTRAGVHMEIPAERWFGSWFGNSSSYIWEQNTMLQSQWADEAGRDLGVIRTPERMMSQLRPMTMKRNVERLLNSYCSYGDDENQAQKEEDARKASSLLEYIVH